VPYIAGEVEGLPAAVPPPLGQCGKKYCHLRCGGIEQELFSGAVREHQRFALFMFGASHTRRMTDSDTASRIKLVQGLPRWTSDGSMLTECVQILTQAELTSIDCVFLDIFSNTTYLGTDERGLPAEPQQDEEGGWHLPGTLDVAPARALRRMVRMATELAIAAGPALVIVCLPLPRYVLQRRHTHRQF
jgi:hypothetical protein